MKYGVGIDISKGKSTIAILSVAGEVIEEPFEINHDIDGLNLLEEKIKDIPKILETPYVEVYPPYKKEIEMIKNKTFNQKILEQIKENL